MSKKAMAEMRKYAKKLKNEDDYVAGAAQVRHSYDAALVELFGGPLGRKISDFLINKGTFPKKKK